MLDTLPFSVITLFCSFAVLFYFVAISSLEIKLEAICGHVGSKQDREWQEKDKGMSQQNRAEKEKACKLHGGRRLREKDP